ncbi:MAG: HEAT repeat domain-containing protein [Candidatus Omnitrophica bacterium]|nr:HEAT repeat domain-containing protein [Candidatus Omnitrophota bacterium]
MMKQIKFLFKNWFKGLVIIVMVFLLYQGVCYLYWVMRAISEPSSSAITESMITKPDEYLITKMYSWDFFSPYPSKAIEILASRKSTNAVPGLIKSSRSFNKHIRRSAIAALGEIGDERAIPRLMEIVKSGKGDYDYSLALRGLTKMKYEPAYPYVIEWANTGDPWGFDSVNMLAEYDKIESIELLKELKRRIPKDHEFYTSSIRNIDEAIGKVEKS